MNGWRTIARMERTSIRFFYILALLRGPEHVPANMIEWQWPQLDGRGVEDNTPDGFIIKESEAKFWLHRSLEHMFGKDYYEKVDKHNPKTLLRVALRNDGFIDDCVPTETLDLSKEETDLG